MSSRGFSGVKKRLFALTIIMVLTSACEFKFRIKDGSDLSLLSSAAFTPYTQVSFSSINQTSGSNVGGCMVIDPVDGSRFLLTMLSGVLTLGANTYTAAGAYDLVISKQNRNGTLLWSKWVTGDGIEQTLTGAGKCMAIADGKVFFPFISNSTSVTLDAFTEANIGTNDSYLLGLNEADGSLAYHRHFATPGGYNLVVGVASRGNALYWSGWSNNLSYAGPAAGCAICANYGAIDAHSGATLWDHRWGGGTSLAYGLTAGNQGDLYLVGLYQSTANDPGIGVPFDAGAGISSGFIERVSAVDGSPIWIRKMTTATGPTQTTAVQIDENNSPCFSITTSGTDVTLEGGGVHTVVSQASMLTSYDLNGNFRWIVDLPGAYTISQVEYDAKYNRFLVPTIPSTPPNEPILFQVDTSGAIIDSLVADATAGGTAYGLGVAIDPVNSSFVLMGGLVNSVAIKGQSYASVVPGQIQAVFFEWK